MKLKQFIEKLSSASPEDMECEVKVFDVSTGNYFSPGEDRASQFDFGKMINGDDYCIFYDTEGLYLNP
jgi:hypothetical protein